MIKFHIGDRDVDPDNIADAVMTQTLKVIRAQLLEKLGAIRHPKTNEFPTITVYGEDLENLRVHIEGSDELVAIVRKRLGIEEDMQADTPLATDTPRVFLCYASEDVYYAEQIASALQSGGIDTWWDKWCISPGDSFRQKIDEGLSECTHFLVLLTPQSIMKSWVNQEIDAGLVRKLKDQCRFLPVRYGLPASSLPPLLSGMHAPEVSSDEDITQIVNDIYGVSRKPPRGTPPKVIDHSRDSDTGYSSAATSIARYLVKNSKHGTAGDPHIRIGDLAKKIDLSTDDTKDALYELSGFVKDKFSRVLALGPLFAEFDRYWMSWNPAEDALQLASDIINDPDFPKTSQQIAERYGWDARRLNSTIHYLSERGLIHDFSGYGSYPWAMLRIVGNDHMRRFVKSRT